MVATVVWVLVAVAVATAVVVAACAMDGVGGVEARSSHLRVVVEPCAGEAVGESVGIVAGWRPAPRRWTLRGGVGGRGEA